MPEWPTQSDYKDALQNPDTAFRDPDLKASQAERSLMGVPRARSGAFASVYKMILGSKAIALKLFNFPNADRAGRYQAVSDYLKSLGPKKPAAMVAFDYNPEGIRIRKTWYPTLTMEWVKGKTLGEWLREAMEKRDTAAVRKMADSWSQLVLNLQAAQLAHGDLQHDNVMVVADTLVLVDYDGLCVPSLAPSDPRKRLEQLEFGKPAYQHPRRPEEKLGLHLDHFAAWVILIALRASIADPTLYTRFVTKTENENLLFTPPDMLHPATSALWPELLRCKDAEVREWSKALRESLDKPFAQIPAFTLDPFATLRRLVATVPRDWAGIAAETDKLAKAGKRLPPDLATATNPTGRLAELCKAARLDYVAIATEADALTRSGKAVPPELKPIAADAVKRVNCRDAVERALAAGDPRTVKIAFLKPLLDGWVERRLITDAENAVAQVEVLDRLKKAAATPGDGRALVKLWVAEGFKVAGVPEAAAYQRDATRWHAQIDAADAFLKLFQSNATEQQLAAAWQRVTGVGAHPDLKPEHRTRGEQAVRRAPVLAKLAAIPAAQTYANDTALLAAWPNDGTLAGCKEAERYLSRVQAARDRVAKVTALQRAIEAADAGTGTEAAVVAAARPLAGYDHPFVDRVALGAKSVAVLTALKGAVEAPSPSDRAIAAALDELRATNVELLARLDKLDPDLARQAAAAGRRRKILDEFGAIDRKYPDAAKQDHRWQTLWLKYKDFLQGRRDTEELRERLTLAVNRAKACELVLAALDAREMFKLRELVGKYGQKLRDYPPLAARRTEIDELLGKADRVIAIQKKLETPDGLPDADDLVFLRDNHSAFRQADRDAIVSRVTKKLKSDARLIAGRPAVRVIPSGRAVAVAGYWAWPASSLVSHCAVAVDARRHLSNPADAEQYSLLKCLLRDHTSEGGGKRVAPPPGAEQVYLTVWAVVELGWATVYGPPLHLGPAMVAAEVV